MKPIHCIVDGVELAGKSYIAGQLYTYLEPTLPHQDQHRLDGCHFFNCDVGVFGGSHSRAILSQYLTMAQVLADRHIIFEKFHLSDGVYHSLYHSTEIDYTTIESQLAQLNFCTIVLTIPENLTVIQQRLTDRYALYPHYRRIAHHPQWYIDAQHNLIQRAQDSILPTLILPTTTLPDNELLTTIISWLHKQTSSLPLQNARH